MAYENMKKAGVASAFAATVFAIGVAAAAVSVSPAAAETANGSFSTRVQELNHHASSSDRSGYYAYAPYSYAQMAAMTTAPQSSDVNGSFASRIRGVYAR
jgi:hypothetical protein